MRSRRAPFSAAVGSFSALAVSGPALAPHPSSVGLWLLDVPLYATLGLITGLFNFVPYIGALAGSIPAIVIGLSISPYLAIYVSMLFLVVQAIEENLISPLISRRTVDLPPVLTLLSQTVLGTLFGHLGLILATPMTAAILTFSKLAYIEGVLGDHPPEDAAIYIQDAPPQKSSIEEGGRLRPTAPYIMRIRRLNTTTSVPPTIRSTISVEKRMSCRSSRAGP